MNDWLLYGANGYTGELIAREAVRRGLKPILAGRNREAIESLGRELGLPTRVFACKNANLEGVALVLHCAGPFSLTSEPMFNACLKAKAHYLDITGEIAVFENILRRTRECENAGIVAIPGVGFDVVPSDCLAAMLKVRLPDATDLSMAMKQSGGISPGTLKTMIENLDAGGMIRREGKLTPVASDYKVRKIQFRERAELAVTIPWGDVSTAFYSTGIPNIEFFSAIAPGALLFMRAKRFLNPLLAIPAVKNALKKIVDARVTGPSQHVRETKRTYLWGEARANDGRTVELRLDCPESYALTVDSSLKIAGEVLAGKVPPGAKTPSLAFGAEFVLQLKGVRLLTE